MTLVSVKIFKAWRLDLAVSVPGMLLIRLIPQIYGTFLPNHMVFEVVIYHSIDSIKHFAVRLFADEQNDMSVSDTI